MSKKEVFMYVMLLLSGFIFCFAIAWLVVALQIMLDLGVWAYLAIPTATWLRIKYPPTKLLGVRITAV